MLNVFPRIPNPAVASANLVKLSVGDARTSSARWRRSARRRGLDLGHGFETQRGVSGGRWP